MTLHEMRDIVDIYYSNGKGGITYEWDKTPLRVWQPDEQREMEIYFTGSSRPGVNGEDDLGQINFNARYVDEIGGNSVMDAFNNTLGKIIDSRFDMAVDWRRVFMEQLIELRSKKHE